jgi:hypothetical protein
MALRSFGSRRDSTTLPPPSIRSIPPRIVMGSLLSSGLASIRETLDARAAGEILSYQRVIAMTKIDGWR